MQPAFLLKCFGKTLFSTRYYDITCTYKNLNFLEDGLKNSFCQTNYLVCDVALDLDWPN